MTYNEWVLLRMRLLMYLFVARRNDDHESIAKLMAILDELDTKTHQS